MATSGLSQGQRTLVLYQRVRGQASTADLRSTGETRLLQPLSALACACFSLEPKAMTLGPGAGRLLRRLETVENTLLEFEPISRIVPAKNTKMMASISFGSLPFSRIYSDSRKWGLFKGFPPGSGLIPCSISVIPFRGARRSSHRPILPDAAPGTKIIPGPTATSACQH